MFLFSSLSLSLSFFSGAQGEGFLLAWKLPGFVHRHFGPKKGFGPNTGVRAENEPKSKAPPQEKLRSPATQKQAFVFRVPFLRIVQKKASAMSGQNFVSVSFLVMLLDSMGKGTGL